MKYNLFSLGILALSSQMVMAYEKGKMNIVFLLADDLRYDAVGYMNKTTIQTPHIDCLANDGTVLLICMPHLPFLVAAERVYLLVCIIAVTELRTFRVLYGERH